MKVYIPQKVFLVCCCDRAQRRRMAVSAVAGQLPFFVNDFPPAAAIFY
jgi:hypothetical protein